MRKRGRIDGNHTAVVEAFRRAGVSVTSTAAMGEGFPDLVCGVRGVTHLCEVKDGSLSPSRRRLTDDESLWHTKWGGEQVFVVGSPSQAAELAHHWHAGLEVGKTTT